MWISKTGAVKALKEAWKKGYEIVPRGNRISIYTENWALEAEMKDLPLEVSQTIVEHYGGIPVNSELVKKGCDNQKILDCWAEDRGMELIGHQEKPHYMHRAPVTYKGTWELFVTAEREWLCVDKQTLDILEDIRYCDVMISDSGMAMFGCNGGRLTVAPGKFGKTDAMKLQRMAEMWVEPRTTEEEVPENMCFFDDIERE